MLLQLAASLTALYLAGAPPAERAPLVLGVRYTQTVVGPLSLQAGAMLRDGNALPGAERLALDGAGERHWGAGPRLRLGAVTLLGAITRTDRRYHGSGVGGYYVTLAGGLEAHAGPVAVRMEHAPEILKQWDADVRQTLLRAQAGRWTLTAARIRPWRHRAPPLVTGMVAHRVLGPVLVTAGWDAFPDARHVLRRHAVVGAGVHLGAPR